MRIKIWQTNILLLLVAAIWGATFPLVKNATNIVAGGVPPFWFLAVRFSLATAVLAVIFWRRLQQISYGTLRAGLLIGLFLFFGFSFQTVGLSYTTSAKAGFITGTNVVLVPLLSLWWLKRKPEPGAWIGVIVATVGLALLSLNSNLIPTYGDLLILLCAINFALHITAVARFSGPHDPVILSTVQFGGVAVLSWIMHILTTGTISPGAAGVQWWSTPANVIVAWIICSLPATAIAFSLQNVLQPYTTPTRTALIFSTEPVWAALFSYLLMGDILTLRGYLGAALILVGMILSELPWAHRAVNR